MHIRAITAAEAAAAVVVMEVLFFFSAAAPPLFQLSAPARNQSMCEGRRSQRAARDTLVRAGLRETENGVITQLCPMVTGARSPGQSEADGTAEHWSGGGGGDREN